MRNNKPIPSGGKGRITFMVCQVEGNDQTLQDGIRNLSSALNLVLSQASRPPTRQLPSADSSSEPLEPDVPAEDLDDALPIDGTMSEVQNEPRKARTTRNPVPIALEALDSAKVTFADYCAGKKPETEMTRALAVFGWLKEQLRLEDVQAGHIYTCFELAGWDLPKDIPMVLRQMKNKKHWIVAKDRGIYNLHQVGELALKALNAS